MTTRADREAAWRRNFGAENPDGDNLMWIMHGTGDVACVLRSDADHFASCRIAAGVAMRARAVEALRASGDGPGMCAACLRDAVHTVATLEIEGSTP